MRHKILAGRHSLTAEDKLRLPGRALIFLKKDCEVFNIRKPSFFSVFFFITYHTEIDRSISYPIFKFVRLFVKLFCILSHLISVNKEAEVKRGGEECKMRKLVESAIQGDADAFLELMEMNSLSMYKVARGILRDDADVADAMQDTILRSFEKIHTLQKPEFFKTWLIRILINECNQIVRHYKKISPQEELPETPRQDQSLAEFEFKEMLGQVDEKYRVILTLYYEQGFKIAEIAELLEINENTVKTRLVRAREQVRHAYFQETPEGGISNERKYTAG